MGQGADDMDSRWAWGGSRQSVEPNENDDWRIEVLNKDGSHRLFVPRYSGAIEPERALELMNSTLDHERFSVRVVR